MSGTDESEYTVAGKNDIFSGGNFAKGVTIKGKGTYIFDGGIRLASTANGKLAVNSGAKVTFEDGAINMITNSTTITGASVRFENGNGINALMHNITIGKNGEMTIAEGAQITMGKSGETFAFSASSEGSVLNIELCDSYIASLGYAAIVGVDGGSNTLSANSITLSATEEYVLDLVLGNAGAYSYKLIDANTVSAELTTESFVLSSEWKNWEVSDYTAGVVTLSYIPEPSLFGSLAGIVALSLACFRRRKQ